MPGSGVEQHLGGAERRISQSRLFSEVKASLAYRTNFKTARGIQRNPAF